MSSPVSGLPYEPGAILRAPWRQWIALLSVFVAACAHGRSLAPSPTLVEGWPAALCTLQSKPRVDAGRLAIRDATRADTMTDSAADERLPQPAPAAERTEQTSSDEQARAATSAPASASRASSSQGAGATRDALEALDQLALFIPILDSERGKVIRLQSDELFEPGGVALSTLQSYKLARVAQALRKQAGTIIVQAYTDSLGSEDEARALSLRRAQAIASFLRRSGVRAARLSAEGLGPANPIDDNATPEGRERNRRVELVLQATTSREADGSAAR